MSMTDCMAFIRRGLLALDPADAASCADLMDQAARQWPGLAAVAFARVQADLRAEAEAMLAHADALEAEGRA